MGVTSLTVKFSDLSTNSPTSWLWTFGSQGQTSTAQNPSHTFSISPSGPSQSFTVTLVATNAGGSGTLVKTNYINVVPPSPPPVSKPVAAFTASKTLGTAPLTVIFTDLSTNGPNTLLWNFGDNTPTSNLKNPTHIFSSAGSYTVKQTVSNSAGSSNTSKVITVTKKSPNVTINLPPSPVSLPTTQQQQQQPETAVPTQQQPETGHVKLQAAFNVCQVGGMKGRYRFTDTSSGSTVAWKWDFGRGRVSEVKNPIVLFEPQEVRSLVAERHLKGAFTL